MNQDHQDAMELIMHHFANIHSKEVSMLSVFAEGAHYSTLSGQIAFVPFLEPCHSATDIRKALVAQTALCRDALSTSK